MTTGMTLRITRPGFITPAGRRVWGGEVSGCVAASKGEDSFLFFFGTPTDEDEEGDDVPMELMPTPDLAVP